MDGGLSFGLPALPQLATSTIDEWEAAGYDRAFVEDYLGSNRDSYNHPNAAIEPRIPGIFQYYSVAEDELAKGYAGQYKSAQETRRRHRRRLGEDHRPDRPRQPDRALQGLARHVAATACKLGYKTAAGGYHAGQLYC